MDREPSIWKIVFWKLLRLAICGVVILFVASRARELWQEGTWDKLSIRYEVLVVAGLVYLAGWLPSVWFWKKMMASLGASVGFADAARAYYCGHLGKYVPGKAVVLVIRSALLKGRGARASVAALTATYETLLMMGAGAAVAIALIPWMGIPSAIPMLQNVLAPEGKWASLLFPVLVFVACLIAAPVISWMLSCIARATIPAEMKDPALHLPEPDQADSARQNSSRSTISTAQIAQGLFAFAVGWMLLGLSLGITLYAIGDGPIIWSDWPLWTGAVAAATVLGFVMIFVPGGIGVREGVLMELLQRQPTIGQSQAVAAAIILRMVWLVAEITAAVALYYGIPAKNRHAANHSDTNPTPESATAPVEENQ